MAVNLNVLDHPLLQHKLSHLRQPNNITHSRDYERLIYEMGLIMMSELARLEPAIAPLVWYEPGVHPSHADWRGGYIIQSEPIVVAVVRSGLVIAQAARELLQTSFMAHIGVFEERASDGVDTATQPFMVTIPDEVEGRSVVIFDLFTVRGKSAERIIDEIVLYGADPADIFHVSLIISDEAQRYLGEGKNTAKVKYYSARTEPVQSDWLNDVRDTYHRLYRTMNRPDYLSR